MIYDNQNVNFARKLRKDMTPWERKLWYCYLRKYPIRFQRQRPIGQYIVDFYCAKAKLVIELDGGGHFDPQSQKYDAIRTNNLEHYGLRVMRFSNRDIDQNFEGVCTVIDRAVRNQTP